ncbi:MAG: DUF4747 family protein [Xanthobacteraceae bacterium]
MPEVSSRITVGALNISASPHPAGVYRQALQAVADKEVHIGGSDWAKITDPGPLDDKPDWLFGQILVWTRIDTAGRWLNKRRNREATPEEKGRIALPGELEPNFRAFDYIFIEPRHRLMLQYRNEMGDHFGPKRAERLFSQLLSPKFLAADAADFSVTVVPEDDSVDKIFAIEKLRWLEIFIKRPNSDDIADEAAKIHRGLRKIGAKSQTIKFVKAPKVKTLTPTPQIRKLADVAATDGAVSGGGRDADGKPVDESTERHPKTRSFPVEGTSAFAAFLSAIRLFQTVAQPTKDDT